MRSLIWVVWSAFVCLSSHATAQLSARDLLIQTAAEAQECEKELNRLEGEMVPIKGREAQAIDALKELKEQVSTAIRQIRHMHQYTPVVALLSSQSPQDYIHVNMALRALLPAIERRDEKVIDTLKSLVAIRSELTEKREAFKANRVKLKAAAKSINQIVEGLNLSIPQGMEPDVMDTTVKVPAIGTWTGCFDSTQPKHESCRKGALITTRSQALVVSPISGKILSAGPMESRTGQAVVVQQGAQHFLIAGLGTLMCRAERTIRAGEPIGRMPAQISEADGKRRPSLYIEVWQGGQLVNPEVVFPNQSNGKV